MSTGTEIKTKTQRLSGQQRRAQLLDVTKAIAQERGFHRVSIDAVARRAGISRPIVYGHFNDLTGLLEALLDRERERALTQLAALLPQAFADGDPREQLSAALLAFLAAVEGDPVTWRLVLMPEEGTPEILRRRIAEDRAMVTAQLATYASQALAARDGDSPPDPELAALSLQAVAEDCARLLLDDPDTYPIDRLVTHARWLIDLLGLAAPESR